MIADCARFSVNLSWIDQTEAEDPADHRLSKAELGALSPVEKYQKALTTGTNQSREMPGVERYVDIF